MSDNHQSVIHPSDNHPSGNHPSDIHPSGIHSSGGHGYNQGESEHDDSDHDAFEHDDSDHDDSEHDDSEHDEPAPDEPVQSEPGPNEPDQPDSGNESLEESPLAGMLRTSFPVVEVIAVYERFLRTLWSMFGTFEPFVDSLQDILPHMNVAVYLAGNQDLFDDNDVNRATFEGLVSHLPPVYQNTLEQLFEFGNLRQVSPWARLEVPTNGLGLDHLHIGDSDSDSEEAENGGP